MARRTEDAYGWRTLRRDVVRLYNDEVRAIADRLDYMLDESEWPFRCECGADDCGKELFLTAGVFDRLRERDEPLLAPGHRRVTTRETRARAKSLVEEARALRAQARHQLTRARRLGH